MIIKKEFMPVIHIWISILMWAVLISWLTFRALGAGTPLTPPLPFGSTRNPQGPAKAESPRGRVNAEFQKWNPLPQKQMLAEGMQSSLSLVTIIGPPAKVIIKMEVMVVPSSLSNRTAIYVQGSTNLVNWATITNWPIPSPTTNSAPWLLHTLTLTNSDPQHYYRTAF